VHTITPPRSTDTTAPPRSTDTPHTPAGSHSDRATQSPEADLTSYLSLTQGLLADREREATPLPEAAVDQLHAQPHADGLGGLRREGGQACEQVQQRRLQQLAAFGRGRGSRPGLGRPEQTQGVRAASLSSFVTRSTRGTKANSQSQRPHRQARRKDTKGVWAAPPTCTTTASVCGPSSPATGPSAAAVPPSFSKLSVALTEAHWRVGPSSSAASCSKPCSARCARTPPSAPKTGATPGSLSMVPRASPAVARTARSRSAAGGGAGSSQCSSASAMGAHCSRPWAAAAGSAVKTATYRGAVGVKTAGIRW
jgi:hypothetical protein